MRADTIDWYYDFVSPFAFLQAEVLARDPLQVPMRCKPVLFAGLLDHWGQLGPAEIGGKRRFTFRKIPPRNRGSNPITPLTFCTTIAILHVAYNCTFFSCELHLWGSKVVFAKRNLNNARPKTARVVVLAHATLRCRGTLYRGDAPWPRAAQRPNDPVLDFVDRAVAVA